MKEILSKNNQKYAYECFSEALEMGMNFKLNSNFKEKKYLRKNFDELLKTPVKGTELKKLLNKVKSDVLPYCSNFGNESFMGFPDAGNSIAGISGAILSDFLQQNLINSSFCAPIATYMEIAVIKWFRELLGYKIKPINNIWDVGGVITYGGTGSNATAMLLARENFKNNTMKHGVQNPSDYKIIIPKGIGHYSIKSSSMWIGCGDNVIEVETENFRYNLKELKKVLKIYKGKIMCVVAYVGDSRTMTIENLKKVYEIVKESDPNIWLHADACHGFSLAFSKKLRSKIDGIELFDSISTDPIMQEDFAWGQITPFIGSKSWVSLKIWFMIQNIGVEKIGNIIEKRCKMAETFAKMIDKTEDFVLLNDININSVVFMYVKSKKKLKNGINVNKLNELNMKVHQKMMDEGKYHLHKFSLPDDKGIIKKGEILYPLRYMSGNPNITEENLCEVLNYIRKIGKDIK